MDAATRRTEMNAMLGGIADLTARTNISTRFDAALAEWEQAATPEEKAAQEMKLDALRTEAQQAAAPGGGGGGAGGGSGSGSAGGGTGGGRPAGTTAGLMSNHGFWLVAAVTVAAAVFVFFYFDEPGAANFKSDGSVRPLLVLTLIIAMLGFGGLLIVRALFAPESFDKLSERFRLAREIFLVFAGTFGTIVGFYFGSETDNDAGDAAPTVEVGHAEGRVTATVSGGHAPFMGIYTPKDAPAGSTMTVAGRTLTFAVAEECPTGAEVEVIDGRGRRVETAVTCPAPDEAAPPPTGNDNLTDNIGNAAGENAAGTR
ncbi:MAG TPA: hypothetical protein VGB79_00680 [Allosphingosinicella sp.]|jgi:hypothetical protein